MCLRDPVMKMKIVGSFLKSLVPVRCLRVGSVLLSGPLFFCPIVLALGVDLEDVNAGEGYKY
jgi:hypothetical protein